VGRVDVGCVWVVFRVVFIRVGRCEGSCSRVWAEEIAQTERPALANQEQIFHTHAHAHTQNNVIKARNTHTLQNTHTSSGLKTQDQVTSFYNTIPLTIKMR